MFFLFFFWWHEFLVPQPGVKLTAPAVEVESLPIGLPRKTQPEHSIFTFPKGNCTYPLKVKVKSLSCVRL